ncbi:MAG: RIP metalloprotease RseP [Bacteroidales bacterium]|nr:RIP metalloprotease RseP [Bacteroidales bacterium]
MVIAIKVIQFFLALSILVFVHELGHFMAAKAFKVRVDKFYLFFDWGFSLLRVKRVNGKLRWKFFSKNVPDRYKTIEYTDAAGKKQKKYEPIDISTLDPDDWRTSDSTEYGIGWFPLGGYNKIAGMIDESMDKEQMKQPAKEWEFRSKPAWQRFIIMVAGVLMNVVLAIFIYIGLLAKNGEEYLPTSEVNKYGISVDSLGYELGFREGDKIMNINGKPVENFQDVQMDIIMGDAKTVEVEREGNTLVVEMPDDATSKLLSSQDISFIFVRIPFVVDGISDSLDYNGVMRLSPAKVAGLAAGDQIIGIDEVETPFFHNFKENIVNYKNQEVELCVIRNGDTLSMPIQIGEEPLIGATVKSITAKKEYTFWQAIPAGFVKTFSGIADYWRQLKLIFNPSTKAYESVGGFISIGKIFPDTWDWSRFWIMTAFLSIALAVMNILPIPALDGGHILFLLYEIITRRKPSEKFMEIAEYIGLAIVLALVLFANGNDIIKLFR